MFLLLLVCPLANFRNRTPVNLALLLCLFLVPVAAVIALAGDRIGHKIGKRRHSLFGLRPRHTATLMTVLAGVAIALLSFGLMYASLPTFRRVLSDGARLYAANRSLKKQNRALQQSAAEQSGRVKTLHDDVTRAEKDRNQAQAAQQSARADLLAARKQVTAAQTSVASARSDLASARQNLQTTQSELRAKQARVAEAEARAQAARARANRAAGRLAFTQRQYALAGRQLASARHTLNNARHTLGSVTRRASEAQKQADARARQVAEKQQQIERAQARLSQLAADVDALESRRARLMSALDESVRNTFDLRQGHITYEVGEEVDRQSLPSGLTPAGARRELIALITRAAGKAAARGAKPAPEPNGRAVFLVGRRPGAAGASATTIAAPNGGVLPVAVPAATGQTSATGNSVPAVMDEDSLLRAAADAIAQAENDVAVLVVAGANAVEGEPVPVELRPYRNRRVLKQNAVIGRLALDGTRPQAVVADALYAFLRRDVRKQLLDSGVIPPSPNARSSSGDDAESVVQIGGGEWLRLLSQVREAGTDAQVIVRAASDLRAADPVALRFEVVAAAVAPPPPPSRVPVRSSGGGATPAGALAARARP